MVSVVLRGLYCVMKDGYCELVPLLCTLPVSTSGQVWKMSEVEWRERTARGDGNDVLTYAEFAEEWNAGNIKGIDEYEKLLLITCRHANGTGDFQAA